MGNGAWPAIKNGRLQAAENNDAALDIDLTQEGDGWKPIYNDDGESIAVSVSGEEITICTATEIEQDYTGTEWENVIIDFESEQLKELALFPGEPEAYFYVDSTDGEYFPVRGGGWDNGAHAGVFSTNLYSSRALVYHGIGFRSAYFKKN